jgi:hypothetical protein
MSLIAIMSSRLWEKAPAPITAARRMLQANKEEHTCENQIEQATSQAADNDNAHFHISTYTRLSSKTVG